MIRLTKFSLCYLEQYLQKRIWKIHDVTLDNIDWIWIITDYFG